MVRQRYTVIKASFGDLFITARDDYIVRISTDRPHILAAMRQDDLPLLKDSAAKLQRYLNGEDTTPSLKIAPQTLTFTREVYNRLCRIPYGHAVTSEDIAEEIGKPHAVRAVETICRDNPFCIAIPSHRVILSEERHATASSPLTTSEALRRLEKRYLDKGNKRR